MGMRLSTTLRRLKTYRESTLNLIDNTIRFQWSHAEFLSFRSANILNQEEYRKLPRWAKERLSGFEDALLSQCLWRRAVVFSYVIDSHGNRAGIDSEEYRKVSPMVIHNRFANTGCYMYREPPHKLWTEPTEGVSKPASS